MGKHYPRPVELVDIFPTINDLLGIPFNTKYIYGIDNSTSNGSKVSKKKG
jgi:arylsulfatase A-like enzyme